LRKIARVTREGISLSILKDKESTMIKPLDQYSPEDRAFLEYVERLRKQPPLPGFPRKTITELGVEQGVGPIDKAVMVAILRGSSAERVEELPPASG
jgi:hypothetical protein